MADVFLSYARADATLAGRIADELRSAGLDVFYDIAAISPGEDWSRAISNAIGSAKVIVALVSEASIKSEFISIELAVAKHKDTPIIPVAIDRLPSGLPTQIRGRQALVLGGETFGADIIKLIDSVRRFLAVSGATPALSENDAKRAGAAIAQELRTMKGEAGSRSVFVVHGHDATSLEAIEKVLNDNAVEPIVLTKLPGDDQSLFQRFLRFGTKASFAVVILSADDYGASRFQYEAEGVGERSLQFRARQNVILELGFFYGHLGWENVFVLFKSPERAFPNFERPSDLEGVVFHRMDERGDWKSVLTERLEHAKLI